MIFNHTVCSMCTLVISVHITKVMQNYLLYKNIHVKAKEFFAIYNLSH